MKLKFTGIGSCFHTEAGNTGAYFIKEKELYLFDCGESVFERMRPILDGEEIENIVVLITHLHSDHVGSLGSFLFYCNCVLKKKPVIFCPDENILTLLRIFGVDREIYEYVGEAMMKRGSLKVEAIPTEHSKTMKSFGYLVEDEEERVYYSGDSNCLPRRIEEEFKSRKITILYQDTCTIKEASRVHLHIEELEELIPEELRKYVYCMHIDTEKPEEIEGKGFHMACIAER